MNDRNRHPGDFPGDNGGPEDRDPLDGANESSLGAGSGENGGRPGAMEALDALLRREIEPGPEAWDRMEQALMGRIRDRREYEEPIDEVIADGEDLPPRHWQRLESRLEDRIRAAGEIPEWERLLKADEQQALGRWEGMEETLFARMRDAEKREGWENLLRAEVAPSAGALERIESRLDARFAAADALPAWEQALKADVYPAPGRWEAMEQGLDARIERQRKLEALSTRPLWLGLGFYLNRPLTRMAAGLVIGAGLALGAWRFWQESLRPIDTYIYQAQGSSAGEFEAALAKGKPAITPAIAGLGSGDPAIQAKEDGALVVVNRRGFVDLRNGSRLEIREASRRKVHYHVAFTGKGGVGGNATFFVNKAGKGEKFLVSTPDYRIEVMGTYFRVDPGMDGRFSTTVLEGQVRIRDEDGGVRILEAGQTLIYDPALDRYRVQDGGRMVPRSAIESLPGVEELSASGILSLSSEASQAEVRIDGRYRGLTPLVVLVPPGAHALRLTKDGHAPFDTVITVLEGATRRLAAHLSPLDSLPTASLAAARPEPAAPKPGPSASPNRDHRPSEPSKDIAPPDPGEAARLLHLADQIQARDWNGAIALYAEVLEHPGATAMRKEAAQFSIARLRADHEVDKAQAIEDFLRYLALHPDGAFAGESWMRLAELEVGRNPDKAIEYYLRCIAKFPRHHRLSELQHRLGLLYLQNRRFDEAVSMFRQSLGNVLYNSGSERKRINASLYRALVEKGDLEAARHVAEQMGSSPETEPAPR
jgi:tetratricopeptide (TPR) repeat protein